MVDFLKFMGAAIVAFAVLMGGVLLLVRFGNGWECQAYARATGLETRMQAMTCYIKGQDRWYAWEEWKLRGATKGT